MVRLSNLKKVADKAKAAGKAIKDPGAKDEATPE